MAQEEQLDHVARPMLPWRTEFRAECGLPPIPGRSIIDRNAFRAKLTRQGKTRSAMTTCITCWQTASRWKDWSLSPSDVVRRELPQQWGGTQTNALDDELRAIAALIEAHREEFDGFLIGLAATADLSAVRAARRRAIVGR